jgi:hypothetical protein
MSPFCTMAQNEDYKNSCRMTVVIHLLVLGYWPDSPRSRFLSSVFQLRGHLAFPSEISSYFVNTQTHEMSARRDDILGYESYLCTLSGLDVATRGYL